MNLTLPINGLPKKMPAVIFIFLSALMVMGIAQDYIEAWLQHQHFYFSESLLFKAFWLPFILIMTLAARFLRVINRRLLFWWLLPPLATLLHLILYAGLITAISYLTLDHVYGFGSLLIETIAEDLYKYLLVYSLTVVLFRAIKRKGEEPKVYRRRLILSTGKRCVNVDVTEIAWISADSPYIGVYTTDAKHLVNLTLKSIQEQLNPAIFVRIHRSAIVNIQQVLSYRSRLNGDYDVVLKSGTILRASRNFSKSFRERLTSYSSEQSKSSIQPI